jgi:hypothetical protein
MLARAAKLQNNESNTVSQALIRRRHYKYVCMYEYTYSSETEHPFRPSAEATRR